MEQKSRIRINLNTREFEVEGSEKFIEKYNETIDAYLSQIKKETSSKNSPESFQKQDSSTSVIISNVISSDLPESFGEYFVRFPKDIKDVDKALIAGYFAQTKSADNTFSTREVSSLLIDQGVSLTNTAQSIKINVGSKRIFRHEGKFRVSAIGIDYVSKVIARN